MLVKIPSLTSGKVKIPSELFMTVLRRCSRSDARSLPLHGPPLSDRYVRESHDGVSMGLLGTTAPSCPPPYSANASYRGLLTPNIVNKKTSTRFAITFQSVQRTEGKKSLCHRSLSTTSWQKDAVLYLCFTVHVCNTAENYFFRLYLCHFCMRS